MTSTALAYTEYEAIEAVDEMSNIQVLQYVDKRVVSTREMTMAEYRIKAIELMMEAA